VLGVTIAVTIALNKQFLYPTGYQGEEKTGSQRFLCSLFNMKFSYSLSPLAMIELEKVKIKHKHPPPQSATFPLLLPTGQYKAESRTAAA
jgi:hypothetical protein